MTTIREIYSLGDRNSLRDAPHAKNAEYSHAENAESAEFAGGPALRAGRLMGRVLWASRPLPRGGRGVFARGERGVFRFQRLTPPVGTRPRRVRFPADVSWKRPLPVAPFSPVSTNFYAYDARGQVTNVAFATSSDAYAYDHVGNRLSSSDLFGARLYDANGVNQYVSVTNVSSAAAAEPEYDLDGNLVADGTFEYECDACRRLLAAYGVAATFASNLPAGRIRQNRKPQFP